MAEAITWVNIRLTLDELDPWPRNPRQIKGEQVKRLEESYDEFGEVEPIAVGPKGENGKYPLYNGHQRYFTLKTKHGGGFEVDARLSSRPLTEKEREKLTVYLHRGATGEWNWDELANWGNEEELISWGFTEKELQFDMPSLEPEKTEPETIPEQYMILIECEDEQTQAELLDRFNVEGLKCKALIS